MDVDLWHTRNALQRMQADQERLREQLEATGLTSFADRADWLMLHASADEQLAWRRRWRALGVTDPEPREPKFVRGASLAAPRPRRHRRREFTARQMEIAIAALAAQEAAEAAERRAA